MAKVAFIGLGVMGYPMARHLLNKGHEVTVYNRTFAKAQTWVDTYGGRCCPTPKEAAEGQDIVFTCVGNDNDLREVVLGHDGAIHGMEKGTVLVDHTTASADVARELHQVLAEKGVDFLDAPVSGGQAGAENGALTVMVGGDEAVFSRVKPVIEAFARCAERLGEVGAGQLTKMVNQICIAGVVQGLAEALQFARKAGLDGEKVIEVISKGAAQSWQMENRGKTMSEGKFDFGFAVDWAIKDLGIVTDCARSFALDLPLTQATLARYRQISADGHGREDTSALIRQFDQKTN